jgi:hypothetical protein
MLSESTVYATFTNKVHWVWLKSSVQVFVGIFVNHFLIFNNAFLNSLYLKLGLTFSWVLGFICLGYIIRWVVVTSYVH